MRVLKPPAGGASTSPAGGGGAGGVGSRDRRNHEIKQACGPQGRGKGEA